MVVRQFASTVQGKTMVPRSYARQVIKPEMTVRQVALDFPESQEVFRRYGERDLPPARYGHLEPLTHFARRSDIPLERLLAELTTATGISIELRGRFAQRVHRAFILSALALTLTLGAGWGGWLLWRIGTHGDFNAAPAAYVIAHGEAQLWGFIVLFVMGISLRTVLQGAVWHPQGAWICRGLLVLAWIGVGGSMLWSIFPGSFSALGAVSAGMLGLMSLGFWALQIALLQTKWRDTWARAVILSGFWLTVWAAITGWLRWNAGPAGPGWYTDSQRLLLIELAVFGFGMNSIYGFGQMLLPGLLRIGSTRDGAIEFGHWLHNAGTLVLCLATGFAFGGLVTGAGCGLLVGGAAMFAWGHRGFVGRPRARHRDVLGHPGFDLYPPLAFFWLLVALLLLTGGILYESATASLLPHAYMGAVRHALTVGFMTTLILGVGQRMIPVLDRTILALPELTVPILVLIGLGNLLRVVSELAILGTPAAYRIMPISAVLEWLALLLFTVTVSATMFRRDALLKRGRVTKRSSLAVLLAEHPWIEDRLRPTGTRYLERARCVPDELTICSFAASEGFQPTELLARINSWLAEAPSTCHSDNSATHFPQPLELGNRQS
jgi:hypothetical protein